jgi:hypothetical protein
LPAVESRLWPFFDHVEGEALSAAVAAARTRPWRRGDFPGLADYLQSNERLLNLAVEAAEKPKWWVPAVEIEGQLCVQNTRSLREVALVLCARAAGRAGAGDGAGFVRDVLAAKRLGRHVASMDMTGVFMAERIDEQADATIGAVAGAGLLDGEACAALGAGLDGLGKLDSEREAVDVGARWGVLDFVQALATGADGALDGFVESDRQRLAWIARDEVDWDIVLRRMNGSADELIGIMGMRDAAARAAAFGARDMRVAGLVSADDRQLPARLGLVKKARETRSAYSERVAGALEQVFLRFTDAGQRRAAVMDDAARMVVAAAAYRARVGAWPADALSMAPRELRVVPVDMEGRPLRLILGAKGVQIVGAAGKGKTLVVGAAGS